MKKSSIKYLIIFLIINSACKEEFLLESKGYQPILVVDGFITNERPPYTIKLSKASPINNTEIIHFENCIVTLFENSNTSEILTEIKPGIYSTSIDGIQGEIGSNYSLSIITPLNNDYITEPQEMKEPVKIDSVYAELISLENIEYIEGLAGYQFYTDSETAIDQENYFLWQMTETYQYTANHSIYAIYNVDATLPDYQNLFRCWKTQNVSSIFTGKTSNLNNPRILKHPLHFVSTETKKLQERYSLLLKQYTINNESFVFWEGIEEHNSNENFLIAAQPYNIIGNVINIKNPNELIFGNFTVASVSQKRIFVDRPRVPFYYEANCSLNFNYDLNLLITRGFSVFLVETEGGQKAKVKEWCVNCTLDGGKSFKPDFWIDK